MLNSLRERTDVTTRIRCSDRHKQLDDMSRVILDKADLHRDRLQRAARLWSDFHPQFETMQMRLKQLTRTVQTNSRLNLGSTDELRQRIRDLNEVNETLKEDRYRIGHMVDNGNRLLQLVSCPSLKTEFDEFNRDCVDVRSCASRELKRFAYDTLFLQVKKI